MNTGLWLFPGVVEAVGGFAKSRSKLGSILVAAASGLAIVSVAAPATAQSGEPAEDEAAAEASSEGSAPDGTEDGSDAAASGKSDEDDKEAKLVAEAEKGGSPVEDPDRTYLFVGARYRYIIVPAFMMRLFGDGGTTVGVHSFGGEFAVRKNAFEYNFGLWYASYAMDPTPFKAKDDGEDAWELVESELKILYLTADFLWSHDFTPEFALNYGGGVGLGVVFGSLYRTQAYPDGSGGYRPCPAAGAHPYCGNDNDHYPGYEEPSWANGGSKPNIFPWLALQTGLRYKPHKNFVARLDAGFGLSGFFFGLGADYGL